MCPTVSHRGLDPSSEVIDAPLPAPAAAHRGCGSPAHGSATSFTAGVRLFPAGSRGTLVRGRPPSPGMSARSRAWSRVLCGGASPRAPSRPRVQALQRLGGLHPERPGSALPFPAFAGETTQAGPPTKRTRRTSLDAADSRSPPHGPLTRGFERARFPAGRRPAGGPAGGPPGGCPDGTDAGGRRRACRCRFTRRASPPTLWAAAEGEDKDPRGFLIFPRGATPPGPRSGLPRGWLRLALRPRAG